jgi:hypothetical protein
LGLGVPVEFERLNYVWGMFVRKKPNPSGVVSIQIIDKSRGGYQLFRTIGSSSDPAEIELMVNMAKLVILEQSRQIMLPFDHLAELEFADPFFNHIDSLELAGPELLLGKLFDEIGFDAIEDEFRKVGFSKDGKHPQPHIVVGLLVSEWSYPLDYHVFEGNK